MTEQNAEFLRGREKWELHFKILVAFCLRLFWKSIVTGIVLSFLWNWFVFPVFGMGVLSTIPAAGITLIVFLLIPFRHSLVPEFALENVEGRVRWNYKNNRMVGWGEIIYKSLPFDTSLLVLFVGWTVHFWM